MKYIYIKPVCARFLALALLVLCGLLPQHVSAQGYFTLTNGRLWWSNGLEADDDSTYRDPVAFDAAHTDADGNWLEVHPSGTEHVTHITAQGDTYLALDITTPATPQIVSKTSFDLYCVWYRTGSTGYYYQEWYDNNTRKTYRYYLIGASDEGLKVVRSEVGKPLEQSTYWYNWDFGAAVWEKPIVNGVQKNRYYWIMLQERQRDNNATVIPVAERQWVMTNHSYQRPEDIYYDDYAAYTADTTANALMKHYYDEVDGVNVNFRVGNGALFMPVNLTSHSDSVLAVNNDTVISGSDTTITPYGLQKNSLKVLNSVPAAITSLEYDQATPPTVTLQVEMKYKNTDKVPMTVMPAYTVYEEETYRRGIHLNYRYRDAEGVFGASGQATYDTHYFWNDTLHAVAPTPRSENAVVDTIIFKVDNHSLRYVEVDPIARMSTHPNSTTLRFHSPVNGSHTVEIYVTVRYNNGTVQHDTTTLTLTYTKPERDLTKPMGPVVRGAVFGGGRMANVGGGTAVIIHSADSIQTVYGGNDIAGWVQGDTGATIKIGTEFTSKDHPVHIGNVYGGGNGYYTYQGINAGYDAATGNHVNPYYMSQSTSLIYQAYYFNGKVYPWNSLPDTANYYHNATEADRINHDPSEWASLRPVVNHEFAYTPFYIGRPDQVDQEENGDDGDGTIPYIKTAHITVGVPEGKDGSGNPTFFQTANGDSTHWHNDYVHIDTLFGGARNAFIGVTSNETDHPANGVTIDINGGTIYSVFGGNNVGGSVANTSTVFVNVHDTKLVDSSATIEDTYLGGYGRDFGIRYLFGGGNLVDGSHASLKIYGGMLDTVYLGGNNATVLNPIGMVECLSGNDRLGSGYNGHFICTNKSYPVDKMDEYLDPSVGGPKAALAANPNYFNGYGPSNFNPETGKYNIRCLFGGNNAADMDNLTIIQLHSGGISSVYGGGNVGDMTNSSLYDVTGPVTNCIVPDLNGTMLGTGTNQLFPDPLYNYLIKAAYDINQNPANGAEVSYEPGGWADVYGRNTLPKAVGTIVTALPTSKIVCDYVFGGSRMGNVKNSCGVYLAGGIYGYVNGGNDVSGDVGSETGGGTHLVLNNNVLVVGDAIAGSDGYYHCEDVNRAHHYDDGELFDTYSTDENAISYDPYNDFVGMLFPTHNNVNFYLRDGLVLGQMVAGAVHADVGFDGTDNAIKKLVDGERKEVPIDLTTVGGVKHGSVHFMAKGGRVLGNVFGGGFQSHVHGLAYLTLRGDVQIDGSFFSGNDCTGSIHSFGAYINENDLDLSAATTAADTAAAYDAAYGAMVASDNVTPLNEKDDAGTWGANYSAYLRIKDTPKITCVYGSGNGAYDYFGDRPEYEPISYCSDVHGFGLTPKQSSTFIDINISGNHPRFDTVPNIDTVFGGGNGVGVEEAVVVFLNNTENTVHSVHTIFGGNNNDDMYDVVPDIRLQKGIVNTVFGGANNGVMGRKRGDFKDVLGYPVKDVSTHVVLESEDITVLDTVFGGCRMSDVEGATFVEVKNTKAEGVRYIFGGNDISGDITGVARVDVSGGVVKNLFGGSNGRYDFLEIGDDEFDIFPFGFLKAHPRLLDGHAFTHADSVLYDSCYITTAARPDLDSTSVNLWGGIVGTADGGVYGGGSMAECRTTYVMVNDTVSMSNGDARDGELIVYGSVYGGGEGDHEDLNHRDLQGNRYGNVTEATHVHLHHAKEVSSAKAYGGSRGGDVMHTYINTYKGWDTPFDRLYGGCWGGDVFGTAHLDFSGINLVRNLYGGNDFAGDVYKSVIDIHSGRFFNIYGAGNGDYPTTAYTTGVYADSLTDPSHPVYRHIHRPNNEYVEINFYNGTVDSCLYGGGKMGSTWTYQKDANSQYIYVNGNKVPDTSLTVAQAHQDPNDYASILVNVYDGYFNRNIFAGARGMDTVSHPLVYGLKMLNMQGGYVLESVYGGSESVDDGYPAECKAPTGSNPSLADRLAVTTQRPSSILNITGGEVVASVYGTGYQGETYGSAFVNIGVKAIDSCIAWRSTYAGRPQAYANYKPTMSADNVLLDLSVYSGANWGNNVGSSDFTTPGFVGGQSRLIIDGEEYNTANDPVSPLPEMNIHRSVIGAGTSVAGGDIHSRIEIRNYGAVVDCHPTKKIEAVQRADMFHLHNTAIEYTGTTSALSAYISTQNSMAYIDTVRWRGYNVSEYDAAVTEIKTVEFFEDALVAGEHVKTTRPELNANVATDNPADSCSRKIDICDKIDGLVAPDIDNKKYTLLILNKGIDFTVGATVNNYLTFHNPGVTGFAYATTPFEYSSVIMADDKSNYGTDIDKGGFVSTCQLENQYQTHVGTSLNDHAVAWTTYTGVAAENKENVEIPYINYGDDYRVWEVGEGVRLREAALLAHTVPDSLPNDDLKLKVTASGGVHNLALATTTFIMPATDGGHYYMLDPRGFTFSGDNAAITLVDSAWYIKPTHTWDEVRTLNGESSADSYGAWDVLNTSAYTFKEGVKEIEQTPATTFGLVMVPDENFAFTESAGNRTYTMPTEANLPDGWGGSEQSALYPTLSSNLIISGNARVNNVYPYCSPIVDAGTRKLPKMRLYLTYDKEFSSTFVGNITFRLLEYDASGNLVGPVDVNVYVQTIMEDFKSIEEDVLAMYNAGRTNTFTRKAVLPAVLERRNLYLTDVKWVPTNGDGVENAGTGNDATEKFWLMGHADSITTVKAGWYPHTNPAPLNNNNHFQHNRFALSIIPSNNISEGLASSMGWERIEMDTINVYELGGYPVTGGRVKILESWDAVGDTATAHSLKTPENERGRLVGVLDGRGSVSLNAQLTFDGTRKYPNPEDNTKGYVGKVVLGFDSYAGDTKKNHFNLTIYVKTRLNGDTIYIASADHVVRNGCLVRPYDVNATWMQLSQSTGSSADEDRKQAALMVGRSPNTYVQSFHHALKSGVYQEGDVLCILDTVKVDAATPVVIQGANGPAIPVVRYDGHHHEFPDEGCVYRGPMIEVDGNGASFTARNIAFHGGAGATVKHVKTDGSGNIVYVKSKVNPALDSVITYGGVNYKIPSCEGNQREPDTNAAYAPIVQVSNGGLVSLANGSTVTHNWNAYDNVDATGMPDDSKNMGAISVTSGGTLSLTNDVTIERNMMHTMDVDISDSALYDELRPGNGAIYVDGGRLELTESAEGTKVTVTDNWLVDPRIHSTTPSVAEKVKWWTSSTTEGETRWIFVPDSVANWAKANVLLTRKAGVDDLHDTQSDVISVSGQVAAGTRVGVSKWFPGPETRDTMQIAKATTNLSLLAAAAANGNFVADDEDNNVFYNAKVNNATVYFFRCATFRHQKVGDVMPLARADGSGFYMGKDVLYYSILSGNSCPVGGDTAVYRIQGGFAPYTYTWEKKDAGGNYNVIREYTSPYSNTMINNRLASAGDTSLYWASLSDTLLTPAVDMTNNINTLTFDVRVAAVDATGECRLYKDIQITLHKTGANGIQLWDPVTTPEDGWTDTARTVVAKATRNYRSIRITPYVWTDGSQGMISAKVGDTRIIYQEYGENDGHGLDTLLFCEGEVIRLRTQPVYEGAEFLMWNFEPFEANPITYVVPPHDDDVIAYYASKIHWSDTINTPAEAGVASTNTYYYESRPTVAAYNLFNSKGDPVTTTQAGYVTVYNGDVHIYNENGLAWFISIVNGLNGFQSRPFRFNTVYLHAKDALNTPYDMQKFLWSPVGTRQYGFRGQLVGVGHEDLSTTPLHHYEDKSTNPPTLIGDDADLATWLATGDPANVDTIDDRVVIKNIVLNEPNMNYVGFFGLLDMAEVTNVTLQDIFVRGSQYVGGLAAQATNTTIDNCAVISDPDRVNPTTTTSIITTGYVSGGLVGDASNNEISNVTVEAKYTGNAVYSGGVTGVSESDVITNVSSRVDDYQEGLYKGGVTGSSEGVDSSNVCPLSNLRTTVSEPTDNGTPVFVSWQTTASNVQVSFCEGSSWVETADSTWQSVSGNSTTLTLPVPEGDVSGYTIAVRAWCDDSTSSMLTTYVPVANHSQAANCPAYQNLTAVINTSTTNNSRTLKVTWELVAQSDQPSTTTENVRVGYCVGTTWDGSATTSSYASTAGTDGSSIEFTLSNYSDTLAYTVALYSPCNDTWYTYTISGCPIYQIVNAVFNEADPTSSNSANTVEMMWRSLTQTTETGVLVGLCPGSDYSQSVTNSDFWTSATSTLNNDGVYTHVFDNIDAWRADNPDVTIYTVAIKSPCSGAIYTRQVTVPPYDACPQYEVHAVYNEPVTGANTDPTVTVYWIHTTGNTEDSVHVQICSSCGTPSSSCDEFTVSANSHVDMTSGNTGSTFTLTNSYVESCTTYTVTLSSVVCPNNVATTSTNEGYQGSIGPLAGNGDRQHRQLTKRRNGGRTVIANSYVYITGHSRAQRIGGIVGRASNTDIMNNYVHGTVGGNEMGGSLTAVMGQGTYAMDNFSAHGTAKRAVGRQNGGAVSNSTGFEGQGNQVMLDQNVMGVNNLTRALNRWVREQNAEGGSYKTWRSDLVGENYGYPLFGEPNMIPVEADSVMDGCGEVVFNGITYTRDTMVTTRIVDSVEMVDSTVTATIRLHHGAHTQVRDSVPYGDDYSGYGFFISAEELRLIDMTVISVGRATIVLHDTLTTEYGCDSIVTLTLTFTYSHEDIPEVEVETGFTVNVYPNPTTGLVNVEAENMTHVEVYDNEGRKLQNYEAYGRDKVTVDMTRYATGVYFVRVHSPKAVVIQKVIRER